MVAGKYTANGNIMKQEYNPEITFIAEGNVLSGEMIVGDQVWPVLNGKVDGDDFSYMLEIPSPIGKLTARVKGSVSGDDINFIIKNPLVKSAFKGKRIG